MAHEQRTWSPERYKVIQEVEIDLKRAFEEARAKLVTIGI